MFHVNSPKEALYHVTSVCVSQELQELGGLKSIRAELPDWPVSDDTVLHLATAEGLITGEVIKTAEQFDRSRLVSLLISVQTRSVIGLLRSSD